MSLPSGYTEVQYIQGTGTQKINTDVIPTINTKLLFGINMAETTGSVIIGNMVNDNNDYRIFDYSGQTYWDIKDSRLIGAANSFPANTYFDIECANYYVTQNGIKTVEGTKITAFTADTSIFIFAASASDTACAKGALYYLKIYDNTTLIRDYIPCINPDGEVGLYDTANSKFYGNSGTGAFFAGPPKVTLPSIYTQLEYILSSATQIIDTGITPGNTTKVEIDFEPTTLDAHHLMILGVRNTSSGGNQFAIGWTGHKSPAVWRSDYGSSQVSFTTAITGAARHYAIKNGASCKIDTETVSNTAATFTSSYTLYLFAGNQAGTAVSQITAKLYRCKIYTSDQLDRDFIPCMNAAGAIGLYDLVNSKFYANAGTGVFTAGPEVTWPSNDGIYVKINGIWKQIEGIKLL